MPTVPAVALALYGLKLVFYEQLKLTFLSGEVPPDTSEGNMSSDFNYSIVNATASAARPANGRMAPPADSLVAAGLAGSGQSKRGRAGEFAPKLTGIALSSTSGFARFATLTSPLPRAVAKGLFSPAVLTK